MKKELEDKLFKRFKTMFPGGRHVSPNESLLCFGMECDDGWFQIIWDLCETIEHELDRPENKKLKSVFTVDQIKEKFGGLRFYVSCGNNIIFEAIRYAEDLSYKTCEKCGKKGKLDDSHGWMLTLCKDCKKKRDLEMKEKEAKFNARPKKDKKDIKTN